MKIIGTGLVCLDIVHKKNNIIFMNGGTCANVLAVLAQLGAQVSVLIPDYLEDKQKDYFYNTLEKLNIECIKFCNTKMNIPRIIETFDEKNNHLFYTKCPDCGKNLLKNRFITFAESEKLMEKMIEYDIFFTDRVSDGIKNIAHKFRTLGKKVIYEPNSGRNLESIMGMAKVATVVKFSTDRISLNTSEMILRKCQDSQMNLMIATQGSDGMVFSYRIGRNEFSDWIPGPHIKFEKVVDTSGAGDWLTAGFLYYWDKSSYKLEEEVIYNALQRALNLSAICSVKEGALGALYDKCIYDYLKKTYKIKLKEQMDKNRPYDEADNFKICKKCFVNDY